ncbi:MAG: ABC transporter ATP-binding protein [Thermoplasmata archaeon]|nr:ABC transporter ATP-binding protein [Thermoplasmata archaeon]
MSAVTSPAVRLEGVRRIYHPGGADEVRALDGVDLSIGPGDYLSVEGPSGSGKTTLLNLLGLLDVPSEGRVVWRGTPVERFSERERTRLRRTGIGFIFQRFYLLPTLTALENVELPLQARGLPGPERRHRARALLAQVGLAERERSFPHQLSGGEEQRVAIARALANGPQLLLADEPTGELDSIRAQQVLDLLEAAQRSSGAAVVVVTHNPAVATRARRHLTMRDGRIVTDSAGR